MLEYEPKCPFSGCPKKISRNYACGCPVPASARAEAGI
jgi:hypothetical protein